MIDVAIQEANELRKVHNEGNDFGDDHVQDEANDVLLARQGENTTAKQTVTLNETELHPMTTTTTTTATTRNDENVITGPSDPGNEEAVVVPEEEVTRTLNNNPDPNTAGNTATVLPATKKPIKLFKSSRLKGYMTLTLAAFINYDAARTSNDIRTNVLTVIPSTETQRIYAQITAMVSLICTTLSLIMHFDRISPLQHKLWIPIFRNGSRYEGAMILFYAIWWSIATGFETSVTGIAGDGKGQYSLYYSTWACCLTSYWILERWCVASGWSSLNSFISSWPNRSPAWICIMILSFFTLIWYLDLWQNHTALNRPDEIFIIQHFHGVRDGQWQWLMITTVFTFCPAVFFVLIELFRETKADGSTAVKSNLEEFIEGIWFVSLTFAWIATVMIATTPRGAASLIGNSYFFTWWMSIFVFEGFIWYIHDKRKATHDALKDKQDEYRQRQQNNLAQAKEVQRKHDEREDSAVIDQFSESQLRRGRNRGYSNEYSDGFNNQSNDRDRFES